MRFSALQRAENSSIPHLNQQPPKPRAFQCSSASRKFLNFFDAKGAFIGMEVSVLFSEPKIPQCILNAADPVAALGFSALQRAENSSIFERIPLFVLVFVSVLFSEPKIPQSSFASLSLRLRSRFQCSSASRKFLNKRRSAPKPQPARGFSALQRAENSSMSLELDFHSSSKQKVSVLFSEPKIPQST